MVSPHLFMTAAHCGGPGHTGSVQFLHIDEDNNNPGPAAQTWSAGYPARTLPWQSFGANTGGGDTVLWWLSNGTDGVAPGVKYGSAELSDVEVAVGDDAYSFWVNPVENFRNQRLDSTVLHSSGSATRRELVDWRGPTTEYSIYGAPSASGSPVFGGDKHGHRIIGVTSCAPSPEGASRCTSDTTHFVRQHDAERNGVLDAIEYDWLMTEPSMAFRAQHHLSVQRRRTQRSRRDRLRQAAQRHRAQRCGRDAVPRNVLGPAHRRLTTGDSPNYRLLLGATSGTMYIRDISITQENSAFNFDSGDERRSWEMRGASHLTSWGISGAGNFSGVMAG